MNRDEWVNRKTIREEKVEKKNWEYGVCCYKWNIISTISDYYQHYMFQLWLLFCLWKRKCNIWFLNWNVTISTNVWGDIFRFPLTEKCVSYYISKATWISSRSLILFRFFFYIFFSRQVWTSVVSTYPSTQVNGQDRNMHADLLRASV